MCVAGYALSPIDLIPDFIPVLGYLDDLIIVPLGILAVVQMISPAILTFVFAAPRAVILRVVGSGDSHDFNGSTDHVGRATPAF
jgi:uncharacterized membrane protein YkvA (DUF1232 family)